MLELFTRVVMKINGTFQKPFSICTLVSLLRKLWLVSPRRFKEDRNESVDLLKNTWLLNENVVDVGNMVIIGLRVKHGFESIWN